MRNNFAIENVLNLRYYLNNVENHFSNQNSKNNILIV